ncbi:hypothetical protein PI125_g14241 [Phytophthora idaei]|nr:hypothetical protein PI125_g14241 [Phytophthora idaei]
MAVPDQEDLSHQQHPHRGREHAPLRNRRVGDGEAGLGVVPALTRSEEQTWGIFREHVLQHFETSTYQADLREKLQRLKQTADIESYNGE